MAKLNKHASVVDQIQTLVRKQADAQSTVVGTPGADTKQESPTPSTETVDKNKVTPEDNKNEFKQEPSKEEAGKVVSDNAVKSASVAQKIASYNLGAEILVDLLKDKTYIAKSAGEKALCKEAGRRDVDILINQMASQINIPTKTATVAPTHNVEKEAADNALAEQAGAAYFDELYKSASENVLVEKVAALEAQLAKVASVQTEEEKAKALELSKQAEAEKEARQAEKVAAIVLESLEKKLKSEPVK